MKENEILEDEELKKFFLQDANLLCPLARHEESEPEKLKILLVTIRKTRKLLGALSMSNLETHYAELSGVIGFYLVESNGDKNEKHALVRRSRYFSNFMLQLTRQKDLALHLYHYYSSQLTSLERVMKTYYPGSLESIGNEPEAKSPFKEKEDEN